MDCIDLGSNPVPLMEPFLEENEIDLSWDRTRDGGDRSVT